jgi:NTE family protein
MSLPPAGVPASADKTEYRGIALCLSGGGYRASLFHLGALGRLYEFGLLRRLDALSSVSGGSIFSAFLATTMVKKGLSNSMDFADWENDIAKPFRQFTSHDIRTLPVLLHCLWNWIWPAPRLRQLESTYSSLLTSLTLGQLPERPRFILCATDLTFGVNWEFGQNYAGDYQVGYSKAASSWPLARAVAASSCFPPIFGPMRISAKTDEYAGGRYQKPDRAKILSRIALSDGGVYDNMGLEPVWKKCDYVLISDCGAPFSFRIGETPWSRLLRYTSVLTKQTGALRLRAFFADIRFKEFDGTHWSLTQALPPDTPPPRGSLAGYSQDLVETVIANIRTDLDSFTEPEQFVLENHGYIVADHAIRKYLSNLIPQGSPPATAPHPEWLDEAKVRNALKDSSKRFSLRRLFRH